MLERNSRKARWLHALTYILTFVLLFTGWWLLSGREGDASALASLIGAPDIDIHEWAGWLLVALGLGAPIAGPAATARFWIDTLTFRRAEASWFARWPGAALHGRFGAHGGHFDPGQRLANVVMVGGLLALALSGVGLLLVPGGGAFVWLLRIHRWATFAVTPVIAGHVLLATGVLPGYRGVWRAMHAGGRVPVALARRLWPSWAEDRPDALHRSP